MNPPPRSKPDRCLAGSETQDMRQKAAPCLERQGRQVAQRGSCKVVPCRIGFSSRRLLELFEKGNSCRYGALWAGMKTRGGDGAPHAPAEHMIEQRQMDRRRKGDPALDEARLRQQAI